MGFIDCDSHILENEDTWSYLDPSERGFRPKVVNFQDSEFEGVTSPGCWVVGDTWARRFPNDGNFAGNANVFDSTAMSLIDSKARLEDLDALGIDAQVLISTFFIGVELDNPLAEAAITRSYNRWMADRVSDSRGRLRWTLRAPIRLLDRAFEELEFGKEHGAVGIHVRGEEQGMYLSDPYFFPLYERAQDLDLAIIVHLGCPVRRAEGLPLAQVVPSPAAMMRHVYYLMAGFYGVIASDIFQRFPRLRWGFIEGGASWVPAAVQSHSRLQASRETFLSLHPLTPEELELRNVFITCQADEDLGYLTRVLGKRLLVAGTDYGHNDLGSEVGAHTAIMRRADIDVTTARAIVDTNGRRLYGIEADFRPAPEPDSGAVLHVPHVRGVDDREPYLMSTVSARS